MSKWMIYGAYGFTGKLIAQEAMRRGLTPILAGRDPAATKALAQSLGLESRAFSCASADVVTENLQDVEVVLHCAGPFSHTSGPMLAGCIRSKTSYLDITGEIPVFESIHQQSDRLRETGIVAIPGVGFDVVPSDCLAAMLKEKLPGATHLALAFQSSGKISPGTAKTMIEGMAEDGAIRKDGKIQAVPTAFETRRIRFSKAERLAVTIPWGDVSTAYYSTGIPNIKVYTAMAPTMIRVMRSSRHFKKIVSLQSVQNGLKKIAGRLIAGPTEYDRTHLHCYLWGEVSTDEGQTQELRLRIPEAYALTALTALAATERVLKGDIPPGAKTPSQAFGARFILDFAGVKLID